MVGFNLKSWWTGCEICDFEGCIRVVSIKLWLGIMLASSIFVLY